MVFSDKKIAVTGCNGLVGKRVVMLALIRGYQVLGIDSQPLGDVLQSHLTRLDEAARSRFQFAKVDVKDYDSVIEALKGCYGVIHLAVRVRDTKTECHNTNVVMSYNILRAAAELEITRVAQASTANVTTLVFSKECHFDYFPLDEDHQLNADEQYGLSKIISEVQGASIVRRYPFMRVASLRLHWVTPSRELRSTNDEERHRTDLWGYVQQDSVADAFLLAMEEDNGTGWTSGHEAFFIAAPGSTSDALTSDLRARFWNDVPIREKSGTVPAFTDVSGKSAGFYDCRKAKDVLAWGHRDDIREVRDILGEQ